LELPRFRGQIEGIYPWAKKTWGDQQRLKAVENFMNAMASVRTAPPLTDGSTK
jgi:hypothetical protein